MQRECECPKCGTDISESYTEWDPDVGIMSSGWWCEKCDEFVMDDGEPDYDYDY